MPFADILYGHYTLFWSYDCQFDLVLWQPNVSEKEALPYGARASAIKRLAGGADLCVGPSRHHDLSCFAALMRHGFLLHLGISLIVLSAVHPLHFLRRFVLVGSYCDGLFLSIEGKKIDLNCTFKKAAQILLRSWICEPRRA